MLRTLRMFFTTRETNPYLVVLCLLLSSLAETVGIGSLLPIISLASGNGTGEYSKLGQIVHGIFAMLGLDMSLGTLVIAVAAFMLLKAVLSFFAISYATRSAARVALGLRRRLANAIFAARWEYFSEQRSGRLANAIGIDASLAGESYVNSANIVAAAIQAVAYTIVALIINPVLAVIGLCTGLILTFLLQRFVRATRRAAFRMTDITNLLVNDLVDALANIKPLKSMNRQKPILDIIARNFGKLRRGFVTREVAKTALTNSGDAMIALIAAIGIYVASTYLKMPFAELVVSALVFNQIVYVLTRLQRMIQAATRFESSYVRTIEAIEEAEAAVEPKGGTQTPEIGAGCRFEQVNFARGGRAILSGVNLEIPANAITVLSGPSGAGKTTIIDLLIGLNRRDSGLILIGDASIDDVDLAAWRSQIGYVPQELSLLHTSIRANLTLGDEAIADGAIRHALEQAGAADFVSELPAGLDTDVGEMGSKLSGGQRQRISLARALVHKPRVLILDEVTSALDPETEAAIVGNIADLRRGYTIIAITHRPAWTTVADQLYLVADGMVQRAEPPRTLSAAEAQAPFDLRE